MRIELGPIPSDAERWLPANEPDASEVGINFADAVLPVFKRTLADGRKLLARRRGLKITLQIGERSGDGLLRRLEHGPDVRDILIAALTDAAAGAGARLTYEDGAFLLEIES